MGTMRNKRCYCSAMLARRNQAGDRKIAATPLGACDTCVDPSDMRIRRTDIINKHVLRRTHADCIVDRTAHDNGNMLIAIVLIITVLARRYAEIQRPGNNGVVCRDGRAKHTSTVATPISSWSNAGYRLSGCRRLFRTFLWAIRLAVLGLETGIQICLGHLRRHLRQVWVPACLPFAKLLTHTGTIRFNPQEMETTSFLLGYILHRGTRVFMGLLAAAAIRFSATDIPITLALALAFVAFTFAFALVAFPGTGTG